MTEKTTQYTCDEAFTPGIYLLVFGRKKVEAGFDGMVWHIKDEVFLDFQRREWGIKRSEKPNREFKNGWDR